jgi:hypothetical protein
MWCFKKSLALSLNFLQRTRIDLSKANLKGLPPVTIRQ